MNGNGLSVVELVKIYEMKTAGSTFAQIAEKMSQPYNVIHSAYYNLRPHILGTSTINPQSKNAEAINTILQNREPQTSEESINETPPLHYIRLENAFDNFKKEIEVFLEKSIKENVSVLIEKNRDLVRELDELKNPTKNNEGLPFKRKETGTWAKRLSEKFSKPSRNMI